MTEFGDLLARRRMCRSFRPDPLSPDVVERVLSAATRAPAAGNSDGLDLLVLEGPAQTSRYWDVTLPEDRRTEFRLDRADGAKYASKSSGYIAGLAVVF